MIPDEWVGHLVRLEYLAGHPDELPGLVSKFAVGTLREVAGAGPVLLINGIPTLFAWAPSF